MDSEENDMEESPPTVILRIRHCSCCLQREMELPSLSHFRSLTPEKTNHISHIDADVQHTHDTIIKLLHQRAALIRQRNTFVPAVNLPPEILTTIFEFAYCPDGDGWMANANLGVQNYYRNGCLYSACAVTPLFIGSICSAWRSVAWGAPQLWKSITLLYSHHNAEKFAEMLEYWLSKSGEFPLSVTLLEDKDHYVTDVSFKVMDVIMAYAYRLHTFDLFLPGAWEPALICIASRTPSLTRFTIRGSGAGADHPDPSIQFTNMFASASQLREVTLSGYSTTEVLLPWADLESLEVDSGEDNVVRLVEILQLCPRLRRFSVSLDDLIWIEPLAILMKHTAIEVLKVSGYNESHHPEFFKILELPALRSLTLNLSERPQEWSSWLPSFLSRVAGTLETLCLCKAAPLDEELVLVLQVVPKLRKLVLDDSLADGVEKEFTQQALDLLNPTKYEGLEHEGLGQLDGQSSGHEAGMPGSDERRNRHCLVPNLETFEFNGEIAFTPHTLVDFLVARWCGSTTSGLGVESPHKPSEGSGKRAVAGGSLPPTINVPSARKLRSVQFETQEQIPFEDIDADVLQGLRLEGMRLEFLADR